MSNVSTGTASEKRCEELLKEEGYVTWRTRRQRFGNMDMFGLFDVVGVKGTAGMLFVQVKTNRVERKVVEAVRNFKMPYGCWKEVWVWLAKEKMWKTIDCN